VGKVAVAEQRGGHYFITPKDARRVDKTQLTQVGRALSQLGITHIPSYSAQGRGRMERVFGTLQKRLPQELRLARIKTVAVPDHRADGAGVWNAAETAAAGAAPGPDRPWRCPITTPASGCQPRPLGTMMNKMNLDESQ
jgi:hypothetical protein